MRPPPNIDSHTGKMVINHQPNAITAKTAAVVARHKRTLRPHSIKKSLFILRSISKRDIVIQIVGRRPPPLSISGIGAGVFIVAKLSR